MSFPGGSDGKESACNAGDLGSIPRSGRSPREGNSYPLQYSCLENPTDRRTWWATVHGVAESDTTEQLTLSLPFGTPLFPTQSTLLLILLVTKKSFQDTSHLPGGGIRSHKLKIEAPETPVPHSDASCSQFLSNLTTHQGFPSPPL